MLLTPPPPPPPPPTCRLHIVHLVSKAAAAPADHRNAVLQLGLEVGGRGESVSWHAGVLAENAPLPWL